MSSKAWQAWPSVMDVLLRTGEPRKVQFSLMKLEQEGVSSGTLVMHWSRGGAEGPATSWQEDRNL